MIDAPSTVAIVNTLTAKPAPGVTVQLTKTISANVTGAGTFMEIYNEPLIRGTEAKVRVKVNNLGTAQKNNGVRSLILTFFNIRDTIASCPAPFA